MGKDDRPGATQELVEGSEMRAQLERVQRAVSAHLDALLNSIADPLFVKDRQHRWVILNDACCQFMGSPREVLLGKSDYDFFPKAEADVFWEKDELVFESGVENLNEEYFTDAQGETHVILTKKSLFQLESGEKFIVGTIRDITARKRTEDALIRSQQLAAVGTLAAGIAHEFNNINTSVIGNLQFLLKLALPPEATVVVKRALRAAGRGSDITTRLLGFASPGSGERGSVELRSIVNATLTIVEREFAGDGIVVSVTGEGGPRVFADPAQLGQVLLNLLINARHALLGCAERRIEISSGADAGRAFLRVVDTGCGIAADKLPQIFLPFFSGKGEHAQDPEQSVVRGSGLGLSISDTIVRNHGGEIAVQSAPGEGSTFTVWLPLEGASASAVAEPPLSPPPLPPGALRGRILILDDEPDVRALLEDALRRHGHEVVSTGDGEGALAEHARAPFQVALIDLQMSPMSGLEFLARLPGSRPEVVLITGNAQRSLGEEVRRAGASEILRKPFDVSHLQRVVRRLLARRGSSLAAG